MAKKTNNPRNPSSPLFRALTRLFSGPIVNYRSQVQASTKYKNIVKYADRFNSLSGQEFKRLEYDPFRSLKLNTLLNHQRNQRYVDFESMEYMPEIASALDVYADEMTTYSELQDLLTIKCPNEEIKEILKILYHSVLNVNYNLFHWCRSMCKYGDLFVYLDTDEEKGVTAAMVLPVAEIERLEGEDKTNPNYIQFQWNAVQMTFEYWQIAHFRILGNDKYTPYGTSVLDPARRIFRQLILLEDAMMAYRVVRSPERLVFYLDTGGINQKDIPQAVQKVITQTKRNQVVDENTGRVDLRYNPLSIDEDFYIPIRGKNDATRVDKLAGGEYTGAIDDVKYLRDKLFSALKIPMSYLSRGEDASEDKTTLAQKDIRFARTILRLQQSLISELEKIGRVHLYFLGFRNEDLISFKLSLNNPSKIAVLQELEEWRTKFDVAAAATEGYFDKSWIYKNVFNLSDEEIIRIERGRFHDALLNKSVSMIEEGGGEDELGGGDLGGDLTDELEGGDGEGEDEGVLLASPEEAPGNRNDGYLTPNAKGKVYYPEKTDKRGMGARKRSIKSKYSGESASNTRRNTFKGYNELSGLFKGIYENRESIYNEEENKILNIDNDTEHLLSTLENKNKGEEQVNDETKTIKNLLDDRKK